MRRDASQSSRVGTKGRVDSHSEEKGAGLLLSMTVRLAQLCHVTALLSKSNEKTFSTLSEIFLQRLSLKHACGTGNFTKFYPSG